MKRPKVRATWHAAIDGEAHAFVRRPGGLPVFLCGKPRHDERHDWPTQRRCPTCLSELEKEVRTT